MSKTEPTAGEVVVPNAGPRIVRAIGFYYLVLAGLSIGVLAYLWVDQRAEVTFWRISGVALMALIGLGLIRWRRWAYALAFVSFAVDVVSYLAVALSRLEDAGQVAIGVVWLPIAMLPFLPALLLLRRDARSWFLRKPQNEGTSETLPPIATR